MIRSNGSLGLVGRTAVVSEREAGFLYAGYLIRLRPDGDQARARYLALHLESPESRSMIEQTARSTTGVNNINAEEIRRLSVRIPSLIEQDEIVRRATELLELADRVGARASQATARLERSVPAALAKAFRGELVPQDPSDEPAAALLERIRTHSVSTAKASKPRRIGTTGSRTKAASGTTHRPRPAPRKRRAS